MRNDNNIIVREVTSDDVEEIFHIYAADPTHGHTHTLETTIKGWVVVKDGRIACIAGLAFGKGYVEAFSDVMPGVVATKFTRYRYAKILAEKIKSLKIPAMAIAKETPNAAKFLLSLGFKFSIFHSNRYIFRI